MQPPPLPRALSPKKPTTWWQRNWKWFVPVGCLGLLAIFTGKKSTSCRKRKRFYDCIGMIATQTDLKRWYQKIGFIKGDTKEFKHLPFPVAFMSYHLPGKGEINER